MERIRNITVLVLAGGFLVGMLFWQLLFHENAMSEAERRALKQFPEISSESVLDGTFMTEFETFTQDQFPLRDGFRGIKSASKLFLFGQKEVNNLYVAEGYIGEMSYPKSDVMLDHATERFRYVYDTYLKESGAKAYGCIIPDKNYFLGEKTGRLAMDYKAFAEEFCEKAPYLEYISIEDLLSIENYYRTDTHWKQETLVPVAERLCNAMKTPVLGEKDYKKVLYSDAFTGVYYGQLALPVKKDDLIYLTNEMLEQCSVTSFDTGKAKESALYNFDKAAGKDMYELYLSGSDALLVVDNPNAATDKELVVFRDSFGSSLTPLLLYGYKKVTLVDLRYVNSQMLGYFVDFKDCDVLFLYSSLILNNSLSLK